MPGAGVGHASARPSRRRLSRGPGTLLASTSVSRVCDTRPYRSKALASKPSDIHRVPGRGDLALEVLGGSVRRGGTSQLRRAARAGAGEEGEGEGEGQEGQLVVDALRPSSGNL